MTWLSPWHEPPTNSHRGAARASGSLGLQTWGSQLPLAGQVTPQHLLPPLLSHLWHHRHVFLPAIMSPCHATLVATSFLLQQDAKPGLAAPCAMHPAGLKVHWDSRDTAREPPALVMRCHRPSGSRSCSEPIRAVADSGQRRVPWAPLCTLLCPMALGRSWGHLRRGFCPAKLPAQCFSTSRECCPW